MSNGFDSSKALHGQQDGQVNITVKQKALGYQMMARPVTLKQEATNPVKRSSNNFQKQPVQALSTDGTSIAAAMKSMQSAPKGSNKRGV